MPIKKSWKNMVMQVSFKTFAVIFLNVVFISIVVFYYFGAATKINDKVVYSACENAANTILNTAEQVYYSAGYARKSIHFEMPPMVDRIYSSDDKTLSFSVNISDRTYQLDFESRLPVRVLLRKGDIQNNTVIVEKQDNYIAVCSGASCNCVGSITCTWQ